MKNIEFFELLSSVPADCRFSDLPNSYFWNTQSKWYYYFRVIYSGDSSFELHVSRRTLFDSNYHLIYIVYLSVHHGVISVSDIQYSPQSISLMKFSLDELKNSVPFLLCNFRHYSFFLKRFSLAAKVIDKFLFSCV